MKILILTNNDVGLYRFRKELISELLVNNEVYISLPNGDCVSKLTGMGCHFFDTTISRHGTNPFEDLKLLSFFKKLIKKIQPDVVLTYTIKPNIYGGIACSKLKVPYIANITGLGNAIENKGLLQKITLSLYRKGLKKASCVFFQNKNNLDFMLKHKTICGHFELIPGSGVNLSENKCEAYPSDSKGIKFITIGRVMKDKGIFELLEAIKIVKQSHSDLSFKLIGGMDDNCDTLIDNAVKSGLIEYLGHRNDIHDLIKESHAIIHPSYHEGMSNVLLEAAACGRPIIASDIPGCKEIFDVNSGIGFCPRDVNSLKRAIEKFVTLPFSEKEKMGLMGRKKVEVEFDRNIIINKYMNAISAACKGERMK